MGHVGDSAMAIKPSENPMLDTINTCSEEWRCTQRCAKKLPKKAKAETTAKNKLPLVEDTPNSAKTSG